MVLQSLCKSVEYYRQQLDSTSSPNIQQFELLKGLPFYSDWSKSDQFTLTPRVFNHAICLPQKNGQSYPLFDYEQMLFDTLQTNKHVWIKKATGLGVTEFVLRYMAWLCLLDDSLRGSRMCIITGPREDLAIGLIDRMKRLFGNLVINGFDTKETVIELNAVHIEAYPSNHLDSARGFKDVSFIFLDEADFFRMGEQQNARDVPERYIAKSNPWIAMVSTPNAPEGLFERIEKEPDDTCIYKRILLDYTYGLNRIYTQDEIANAKQSPSFEREYNLKYLGLIGNVFHTKDIEAAMERGRHLPDLNNSYTQKSVGLDPGFGSSAFGVCITELRDGMINVLHAEVYPRPDFNEMIETTQSLLDKYETTFDNQCRVFVDGANPAFIRSLKQRIDGEDPEYDHFIKRLKHNYGPAQFDLKSLIYNMLVVPVNFSTEHKKMLAHCKQLLELNGGCIALHDTQHSKLITALRTAVENGDGSLDKEATSHDDLFDRFRLSMMFWH